jgi:hypothetical protein
LDQDLSTDLGRGKDQEENHIEEAYKAGTYLKLGSYVGGGRTGGLQ